MAIVIDLVVDTSALTAILLGEPEAADLLSALAAAAGVGLCAPNRTELVLVIQARLGDVGVERAKRLFALQRIATIPLDKALADMLQTTPLQTHAVRAVERPIPYSWRLIWASLLSRDFVF